METPAAKMRIAWFSVLNSGMSTPSPAAYFSDQVLEFLKERFEIELFHDSFARYRDFPTYHYLCAAKRHKEKPYDLFFYQLEDGKASYFTRFHSALIPGVVLFHDFILSDFGPEPLLNSPWQQILSKFNNPALPWPDRRGHFKQKGPQAYREGGFSAAAVFSSERDHAEYKRLIELRLTGFKQPRSFFLPYPVAAKLSELSQTRRPRQKAWEIIYCGTPRIEHRAHKLLPALKELGSKVKLTWLLGDETEKQAAGELLNEFELKECNLLSGRSPQSWAGLLTKADIALHPLFSAYGQPGPYLAMSLMAGLPCIVSRFGATDYLPEELVFKITPGEGEVMEIKSALTAIIEDVVHFCPQAVSAYAYERHEAKKTAGELAWIFESSRAELRLLLDKWAGFEASARCSVLEEVCAGIEKEAPSRVLKDAFKELGWL